MPEQLTIGEVARRAGLRTSAIRYYESAGVLPTPRRSSGQRRYDASVLQRLAVVQLAQEAGFTVDEIRSLFTDFAADTPASERWQVLATRKLAEVEALIARAEGMKRLLEEGLLRCRCPSLDECGRLISEQHRNVGKMTPTNPNAAPCNLETLHERNERTTSRWKYPRSVRHDVHGT